jgi:hypothetical protein
MTGTPDLDAARADSAVVIELPVGDDRPRKGGGKFDLPENCNVVALGVGPDCYYFLDVNKQLVIVETGKLGRLHIMKLFGYEDDIIALWPKTKVNKRGEVEELDAWDHADVAATLIAAATAQGIWNPSSGVRGAGAWLGDDGELILHCGHAVLVNGEPRPPGRIGRHVYPSAQTLPEPARRTAEFGPKGPGARLLSLLKTWNWVRGDIDAQLFLGWIAAAMIGGALKWRPMVWVTGDKITGKSTLHELTGYLFGGALVQTSDTSAAGLYQNLGHSSLPIAIDELEADADNVKAHKVIQLARQASSGGVMLRGGADHRGVEFQARSAFMFSSILIPPLQSQDRSRMAILALEPHGKRGVTIQPREWREVGRQLRKALVHNWPRVMETIETYQQALFAAGHNARGADQFGTLLALADCVLSADELDRETAAAWADRLRADDLAELQDDAANHERCVAWLAQAQLDAWKGGQRRTVADWIARTRSNEPSTSSEAMDVLKVYGIRVLARDGDKGARAYYAAIANTNRNLAGLFKDSVWASRPDSTGVWKQAFERVPGALAREKLRIAGAAERCTLIPYEIIADEPSIGSLYT